MWRVTFLDHLTNAMGPTGTRDNLELNLQDRRDPDPQRDRPYWTRIVHRDDISIYSDIHGNYAIVHKA